MFQIGYLIATLLVGILSSRLGTKIIILTGFIAVVVSTVGLGLLSELNNK